MVAAWISSGRPRSIELYLGQELDLAVWIRRGVVAGTDPRSPAYWGTIQHRDQRIVEASDIALVLWLTRHSVWQRLTVSQRSQIGRWLLQVNGKQVSDNNWHLFIAFTNVVLRALDQPADLENARQHYLRLKSFYQGDGWFSDGPRRTFDYYNAWGIHYQLYWLDQVDPEWDREFIRDALGLFVGNYRYFFGSRGFPIRGRSICYRMAVPAPLVIGQSVHPNIVLPDEARRALDEIWRYFINRAAVTHGTVTQGYCGPDARLLDNYSGPASCLWSLRSLVVAFSFGPDDQLWTTRPGRFPVDTADVDLTIPAIGWRIVGRRGSGFVTLINADTVASWASGTLEAPGWFRLALERIFQRPFRPSNTEAKYHRAVYRGDQPFCECRQPASSGRSGSPPELAH